MSARFAISSRGSPGGLSHLGLQAESAEELADIGRVVNADIEVGVITDVRRQVQRASGGIVQARLHATLLRAALGQQFR